MKSNPTILVSCGETSGDLHASTLVTELLKRLPEAKILALGGDRVARAGAELLYHVDDYSVIGFSGVLAHLPKFLRLERHLKRILSEEIDLFIPVDYPGLNLRLAAHAKKSGVPVLYYISPQIWAWGKSRLQKLSRSVDYMAVILPFEESIYKRQGIPVEFVGHPFVEDHNLPVPKDHTTREGLGLLPGSRLQEVQRILPVFLDAASYIQEKRPGERFVIGRSPAVPLACYESIISRYPLNIELKQEAREVMADTRLLLVASGTATLQAALFETPLIIVYRMSFFNYLIARRLVQIDKIGLVNIVLEEEVCPEFVQGDARAKEIAREAIELLENEEARLSMVGKFRNLRAMLSGRGGCRRVADISAMLLSHQ
jgi:lipid-A-disaccharide synthase